MTDHLSQLGAKAEAAQNPDEAVLETVPNPHPDVDYAVRFVQPEFTSLCPVTGQPDFAHLVIDYVPDQLLVESKSLKLFFSPFPHGTCLLSVSNQYLALDEIYHPICAPIPRNVTLRTHTMHGGLQTTNRTLTFTDALFQEAYICATIGNASQDYNSRPKAPISMLSSPLFIRHY